MRNGLGEKLNQFLDRLMSRAAKVTVFALVLSIFSPLSVSIATPAVGVTNVTSPQNDAGYLTVTETATVTVTFAAAVTVSGGSPTLTLETGATDAVATYSGGSGTDTLSFLYTV